MYHLALIFHLSFFIENSENDECGNDKLMTNEKCKMTNFHRIFPCFPEVKK